MGGREDGEKRRGVERGKEKRCERGKVNRGKKRRGEHGYVSKISLHHLFSSNVGIK